MMLDPNQNNANPWTALNNTTVNPTPPNTQNVGGDFWRTTPAQPQYPSQPSVGYPGQPQPGYGQPYPGQTPGYSTQPGYGQPYPGQTPAQPPGIAFTPDQATMIANAIGSSATWLKPVLTHLLSPGGMNSILGNITGVPGSQIGSGMYAATLSLTNTPKGNYDALRAILARSGQHVSQNVLNTDHAAMQSETGYAKLATEFGNAGVGIDGNAVKGSINAQELNILTQILADYNRRLQLMPWDTLLLYATRTHNLVKYFVARLSAAKAAGTNLANDPIGTFNYGSYRIPEAVRPQFAFDSASDRIVFSVVNAFLNAPENSVAELLRNILASNPETKGIADNYVAQQQYLINMCYRWVERFLYIKCASLEDYQKLETALLFLITKLIMHCGGLGYMVSFIDIANTIVKPRSNHGINNFASLEEAFRTLNDVPNPMSQDIFAAFQSQGIPGVSNPIDPVAAAAAAANTTGSSKVEAIKNMVKEPASLAAVPTL